jgi:hypothetical protein
MIKNSSDSNVKAPTQKESRAYVNQDKNGNADSFIEFTTHDKMEASVSGNTRFTLLVEMEKQYLRSNDDLTSESAWIAHQSAPYEIVSALKTQGSMNIDHKRMTADDVLGALELEEKADYVFSVQNSGGIGQLFKNTGDMAKVTEYQGLRKELEQEAKFN